MKIDQSTPWRSLLKLVDHDLERRSRGAASAPEAGSAWLEVGRRVYYYALAITRTWDGLNDQDAEDLAADLMLRLQDRRLVLRMTRVGVPAGYFHAILRNSARDLWKRRQFQITPLEEGRLGEFLQETTQAGEQRSALVERLRAELLLLDREERLILELRFERQLKLKEIAAVFDVNFSAVAVRLHRVIRKLKARLEVDL